MICNHSFNVITTLDLADRVHSMEKNRSLQIHPINILQQQLLCANVKYPPLTLDGLINGYSTCQAVKTVIDKGMSE